MNKVVINDCYGGFGLSEEANKRYAELSGKECLSWEIPRHDPNLIKVVEELGSDAASGFCANLKIVTIEENKYYIKEYDGLEEVITPNLNDDHWITIE